MKLVGILLCLVRKMTEDDLYRMFRKCKNLSKHSTYRVKMACIILDHKRKIGGGFNKIKSHPKWTRGEKRTLHAECSAIINTRKSRVPGTTAIIYREVNGVPALARPCRYCMEDLKKFGVEKIIYSVSSPPFFIMEVIG
jgi:deoxycytidylate deaminase